MFNLHVRFWITSLILIGFSQYGRTAWLRCYGQSLDDFHQASLHDPGSIIGSPCFNISLPTMFYAFDYAGKKNGPDTTAILTSYLATKQKNVILVDWEVEAGVYLLGFSVTYAMSAVPHTKIVGDMLGHALVKMENAGMKMDGVHLIGYGLGAHLMGNAGRTARFLGHVVPRITGLDPARPLFELALGLYTGLDYRCAAFVDVIHTDPGRYGVSKAVGSVDIWINFRNCSVQPGCPTGNLVEFSPEAFCSHDRSWRYWVEAVEQPHAFEASYAGAYETWLRGDYNTENLIYLGDMTPPSARGNYFLRTGSRPPYGLGWDGHMSQGTPTNYI
ncbi:pancreatic lipase-related protein 2-like [Epargyreus clarus]|uniref:pancreatic lipase-related protein 2-like n=1 Tax=Epargyreus clarus TaxID=520877 RepID=UPI003C2AB541